MLLIQPIWLVYPIKMNGCPYVVRRVQKQLDYIDFKGVLLAWESLGNKNGAIWLIRHLKPSGPKRSAGRHRQLLRYRSVPGNPMISELASGGAHHARADGGGEPIMLVEVPVHSPAWSSSKSQV